MKNITPKVRLGIRRIALALAATVGCIGVGAVIGEASWHHKMQSATAEQQVCLNKEDAWWQVSNQKAWWWCVERHQQIEAIRQSLPPSTTEGTEP